MSALTWLDVVAKPFLWMMMEALSPFWGLARVLQEMRYLWDLPHSLSGARLLAILPNYTETSVREILRYVLRAHGFEGRLDTSSTKLV